MTALRALHAWATSKKGNTCPVCYSFVSTLAKPLHVKYHADRGEVAS